MNTKTITISPSLLSCDFLNIENELSIFSNQNNLWFHLDVMDGHFVPNLTFGPPIIKMIAKKTTIPLDVHLMVSNPLYYIRELNQTNIHNITFHYEACLKDKIPSIIKEAKQSFKNVSISLKPKTDLNVLTDEILSLVDMVLIMSVEPGFGGQQFINSSLDKVVKLRKIKPDLKIQIDGGVNDKNIDEILHSGIDNIVAGSYIFKDGQKNYLNKVDSLRITKQEKNI